MSSRRIVKNVAYVHGYRIESRSILYCEDAIQLFNSGRVTEIAKTSKVNLNNAFNGLEPKPSRKRKLWFI